MSKIIINFNVLVQMRFCSLACVIFCFGLLNSQTYTNPVLVPGTFFDSNGKKVTINSMADPYVLKDTDGTYYMYVTGRGYPCFSSKDLVNWKYETKVFNANEAKWATKSFWAPEVIKIKDKYYLHYTAAREDDIKRIGIAVSDKPSGPFVDVSDNPFIDHGEKGTIDSHVFVDDDGRTYLYYSNAMSTNPIPELGGKKRSEIWVIEVTPDLTEKISEPKMLIWPTQSWEFNSNSNQYWNEGAVVVKNNGIYYLIYSANCYCNPNYSVGYATSSSPTGPFTKHPRNPILSNNKVSQAVSGPGHNCIIHSPDNNELFFVYHSHVNVGNINSTNNGIRQVNIDRMSFLPDGSINVEGPSITPQPYPSITSGVKSENAYAMKVYPSVTSDKIEIKHDVINHDATLTITSVLGYTTKQVLASNSSIDISDLPTGCYQLNLIDGENQYRTRIIKK